MKKFKALLKSRRGVAIEFAIGVMFITVAVSTILLSTAIHEINAQKRDNDSFSEKLAVEQFAEEALNKLASGDVVFDNLGIFDDVKQDYHNSDYVCEFSLENDKVIMLISEKDKTDEVLLAITVEKQENTYQITSWTWQ